MSRLIYSMVLLMLVSCATMPPMRITPQHDSNCLTGAALTVEVKCVQDFQDTDILEAVQVCYERGHTAVKLTNGTVLMYPVGVYRIKIIGGE